MRLAVGVSASLYALGWILLYEMCASRELEKRLAAHHPLLNLV